MKNKTEIPCYGFRVHFGTSNYQQVVKIAVRTVHPLEEGLRPIYVFLSYYF